MGKWKFSNSLRDKGQGNLPQGGIKMELLELWDLSRVPLFDMDAFGFYELARIKAFDNDISKIPGYMPIETILKYKDAEVKEISWHNCGIAVRFYKEDEDEEGIK